MTDSRETKGHLNWGLWERRKARMTAEADARRSDYQEHYKGKSNFLFFDSYFNRLETSASDGAKPTSPGYSIGSDLRPEQLAFQHEAAQPANHACARHN